MQTLLLKDHLITGMQLCGSFTNNKKREHSHHVLQPGELLFDTGFHPYYVLSKTELFEVIKIVRTKLPIIWLLTIEESYADNVHLPKWMKISRPAPQKYTRKGESIPLLPANISFALARRLIGFSGYFHLTRCNCNHYTDYVIYGRTFGRIWDVTNLPINKKCPLHLMLTPQTDVKSKDFRLKDGAGNYIDPGDPGREIPERIFGDYDIAERKFTMW